MKLEGRVAAVTGGGAGIGRGIVQCLAEEGADVAVIDIVARTAGEIAGKVSEMGRRSLVIEANATEKQQADEALKKVLDTFGRIDILVNNVGGESKYYFEEPGTDYSEEKEWDDTVRLNLKSTMLMCRGAAPVMIEQGSGKIVNIASIAGRPMSGSMRPSVDRTPEQAAAFGPMTSYGVAKAGVIQFSRMLALQLAPYNINVNCICPGVLYTPLYERSAPRRKEMTPGTADLSPREYFDRYVVAGVPLGREQTPEDIGRAVVFLSSEDAGNITGQYINVDGGMAA
jgi:meso-butanediol dehydrogenase/(S,S)-butanediol dehydrogenase/diacetyl reductase